MGALAGGFGAMLARYKTAVDIVTGAIVIFFGLDFRIIFKLNIFNGGGVYYGGFRYRDFARV